GYQGYSCTGCGSPFDQTSARAFGRDLLFLETLYVPRLRWRCRIHGSEQEHFYAQGQCVSGPEGVQHAGSHDHCPWNACPDGNPPHPQRPSVLWERNPLPAVSAEQAAEDGEGESLSWYAACLTGTQEWLHSLPPLRRDELTGALPPAPANDQLE